MRLSIPTYLLALAVSAPMLAGCASRRDLPPALANQDDDAACRANDVAVGSPDYVACRKNRDVQRQNAESRADRAQRNLGDYMMNNPNRP